MEKINKEPEHNLQSLKEKFSQLLRSDETGLINNLDPDVVYSALELIFRGFTLEESEPGVADLSKKFTIHKGDPRTVRKIKEYLKHSLEIFLGSLGGGSVGFAWATILKTLIPSVLLVISPSALLATCMTIGGLGAYVFLKDGLKDFINTHYSIFSNIIVNPEKRDEIIGLLEKGAGSHTIANAKNYDDILLTFTKIRELKQLNKI